MQPPTSALDAALERARAYADIPLPALGAYVRLARRHVVDDLEVELPELARIQAELFNSPDFASSLPPTASSAP